MNRLLLARLAKLEATLEAKRPLVYRYGYLTELPADYAGECYALIASRIVESPAVAHCEFEEHPGRAAVADDDSGLTIHIERPPATRKAMLCP